MSHSEYIVVLNAPSAARFRQTEGAEVAVSPPPGSDDPPVRIRVRTKWVNLGFESPFPRGLWIEVRFSAESLQVASDMAVGPGMFLSALAAFCANVPSGNPELHLAYSRQPRDGRREFMQVLLSDENRLPPPGRVIEVKEYVELFHAVSGSLQLDRISRALRQYSLALEHWRLGGEWLSLGHLYMAVEALTDAAIKYQCEQQGIGEEELASQKNINIAEKSWRHLLEVDARKNFIFDGDNTSYRSARYASDGIEHGFLSHSEIMAEALVVTEVTFGYVRSAILKIVGLPTDSVLAKRKPLDVGSYKTAIAGGLIGEGDPALPGSEYPEVQWKATIRSFRQDGDLFQIDVPHEFVHYCTENVRFEPESFIFRGREQSEGMQMSFNDGVSDSSSQDERPASRADRPTQGTAWFRVIYNKARGYLRRMG